LHFSFFLFHLTDLPFLPVHFGRILRRDLGP
jgi:hypothetical protein